jgi:aspartate kinase
MKVYKFGGISVASATAIKHVATIIRNYPAEGIVVSAMGEMTNAFEELVEAYMRNLPGMHDKLEAITLAHRDVALSLFEENTEALDEVLSLLDQLRRHLEKPPFINYRKTYDQIVPYGELLSSTILSHYLRQVGLENTLLDARSWMQTDHHYGEANVKEQLTKKRLKEQVPDKGMFVTQGFIGGSDEGFTTTLGREGSDYSAALLAAYLGAASVTIWKDVPGLLNADPDYFESPVMLSHISYREAVELAFYGAKVIHPKTIKPLQNRDIPLFVRSFRNMEAPGSVIDNETNWDEYITSFILKKKQMLLTLRTKDFSFMAEDHLHYLYGLFSDYGMKANLMQHSAITLSVCFDEDHEALGALLDIVAKNYEIHYNKNLELITLRHYNEAAIRKVSEGRKVLMEQRSRLTAQVVLK